MQFPMTLRKTIHDTICYVVVIKGRNSNMLVLCTSLSMEMYVCIKLKIFKGITILRSRCFWIIF